MPLQLVTAPYAEPIDLVELQLQQRIDESSDDSLLKILIAAARQHAESFTQCQIVAARWKQTLDSFPCSMLSVPFGRSYGLPDHAILLDRSPVVQVVSIQYLDMGGVLQTLSTSDYVVDVSGPIARITPPFGKIWPIALPQINAVQVTFDAGFAAPITADASSDTFSVAGGIWKTLAIGDTIRLSNSGGALPAPFVENVDYFIQATPSAGVYKLAKTSNGSAIDITDAGQGTHFLGNIPEGLKSWMHLRAGALYQNREEAVVGKYLRVDRLPFVDALLDPYRVVRV